MASPNVDAALMPMKPNVAAVFTGPLRSVQELFSEARIQRSAPAAAAASATTEANA
jgi:hypothetical protein